MFYKMEKEKKIVGKGVNFTRLRRITGYLVPNLERWNSGKKAEEADRIQHNLIQKKGK
jgi:anaerobic ribonucleoside-triphosphate reductase